MEPLAIDPIVEAVNSIREIDSIDAELTPFERALIHGLKSVACSNLALLSGGQVINISPEAPRENLEEAARGAFGRR